MCLAVLRIIISLALVAQTITCVIKTGKDDDSSFYFISQWNLVLITILFITMAVIQIKHEKRLKKFTVDVKPLKRADSSLPFESIVEEVSDDESVETACDDCYDQPWIYWKWLIPIYVSVLCVSVMLTISYWVTEATSVQFLVYIGSDSELMFDLLPTLPTTYLMIEFAFNMIPIDWPMLIFVYILFTLYMFINFMVVSLSANRVNVYDAFNWYEEPWIAVAALFGSYALLALIFVIFWALTQKWKLPKYKERTEERFTGI